MTTAEPAPKRRRDAAATREAILASAIEAFTRHGYDGAGVRGIAEGAGVTSKLVNRYFGTKEKLFAEAVDSSFAPDTIVREALDPEAQGSVAARLGDMLVRRTGPEAPVSSSVLITFRSSASPEATEIVRDGIERHVVAPVGALLEGEDTELRAEIVLSVMAGVWLLRHITGLEALADAEPERLGAIVTKLFDGLIEE
jgi:AcrR family transcriptional regulator